MFFVYQVESSLVAPEQVMVTYIEDEASVNEASSILRNTPALHNPRPS